MTPETLEVLGRRCLEVATSQEHVQWALTMVGQGYDSPTLVMLAALADPVDRWDIEQYFRRALAELGWPVPDDEETLKQYAELLRDRIVDGSGDPEVLLPELWRIACKMELDFGRNDWQWVYFADPGPGGESLSGEDLRARITEITIDVRETGAIRPYPSGLGLSAIPRSATWWTRLTARVGAFLRNKNR